MQRGETFHSKNQKGCITVGGGLNSTGRNSSEKNPFNHLEYFVANAMHAELIPSEEMSPAVSGDGGFNCTCLGFLVEQYGEATEMQGCGIH